MFKEDLIMARRGGFPGGGMPGNMSNLMKQAQRMGSFCRWWSS